MPAAVSAGGDVDVASKYPRLLVLVRALLLCGLLAVAVAGCSKESASTGRSSGDAVIDTVTGFAGEDADVSWINVLWEQAKSGDREFLRLVIACKPGTRECLLVAPDGAGYANLEDFVEDTKLLKPGDTISGAGGIPNSPDTSKTETQTKHDDNDNAGFWAGTIACILLAAALIAVSVWWWVRKSRNRSDDVRLLEAWDVPPDPDDNLFGPDPPRPA
ncbi:hypothetical protein [Amycolatopsis sp. lyj-112]|uniref:hypothetical protein n=1 Tax=Amycolatopsis sp. lyj-112 TaxID=2789288 RepID=UPI00397BD10B